MNDLNWGFVRAESSSNKWLSGVKCYYTAEHSAT